MDSSSSDEVLPISFRFKNGIRIPLRVMKPKILAPQSNPKSVDAKENKTQTSIKAPVEAVRKNVLEINEESNDVSPRFLTKVCRDIEIKVERKAGTVSEKERLAGENRPKGKPKNVDVPKKQPQENILEQMLEENNALKKNEDHEDSSSSDEALPILFRIKNDARIPCRLIKSKNFAQQSNPKSVTAPEKQIQTSMKAPVEAVRKNV